MTYSAVIPLLMVMNPFGNIPVFIAFLKELPEHRKIPIILRECGVAFLAILAFFFFGNSVLAGLQISENTVNFAGGILLFVIAMRINFPKKGGMNQLFGLQKGEEPFLIPMAIPMFAGPGTLSAVLRYSQGSTNLFADFLQLTLAWAISSLFLAFGSTVSKLLSEKGMALLERLMGLVLLMISVEMISKGAYNLLCSIPI